MGYQQRQIIFVILSVCFVFGWMTLVVPNLAPKPEPKPPDVNQADAVDAEQQNPQQLADAGQKPDADPAEADPTDKQNPADEQNEAKPDKPKPDVAANDQQPDQNAIADHPQEFVILGSLDAESGYMYQVELTSTGAAIQNIASSDPRYRNLNNKQQPLKFIGADKTTEETFQFAIADEDDHANLPDLKSRNWKIVEKTPDPDEPGAYSSVVFQLDLPGEHLEIRKTYKLSKIKEHGSALKIARDENSAAYLLQLKISLRNTSDQPKTFSYKLQGPVGVPLESIDSTREYRELKLGLKEGESGVDASSMTAAEMVKQAEKDALLPLGKQRDFVYAGVDVQFFAALVLPDTKANQGIQVINHLAPVVLKKDENKNLSNISFLLYSNEILLPVDTPIEHHYLLFAGPKRQALLAPLQADEVIKFGWFGSVSKAMLWMLNLLHSIGIPYGIAIICLTVMVRGCLFPLSRKQAASAQMMKELQPKIQELRKKYGNDREKMARAQMELFSKNNYNPLAGCLPIFLQLPIFIGLYQALGHAVDLRQARFLWIDNLAAPDDLFPLPFEIPFLSTTSFNLLPILTIVLFIVQQKMFMPPPVDKDQELQYKMMNFMMIFMGFLFYKVPAGLCLYFIASSLWGIGERQLLKLSPASPTPKKKPDNDGGDAKPKGFFAFLNDLQAAADEQQGRSAKKKSKSRP